MVGLKFMSHSTEYHMPQISKQGHGLDEWNVTSNLFREIFSQIFFFESKILLTKIMSMNFYI